MCSPFRGLSVLHESDLADAGSGVTQQVWLPGLQWSEQYEPFSFFPPAKILSMKLLLPVFFLHYLSKWERRIQLRVGNICMYAQSCWTLCNPMNCNPPGSTVHGIFQARYWSGLPCPLPGEISHLRDRTFISCVSCSGWQILYACASWEAPGELLSLIQKLRSGQRPSLLNWSR